MQDLNGFSGCFREKTALFYLYLTVSNAAAVFNLFQRERYNCPGIRNAAGQNPCKLFVNVLNGCGRNAQQHGFFERASRSDCQADCVTAGFAFTGDTLGVNSGAPCVLRTSLAAGTLRLSTTLIGDDTCGREADRSLSFFIVSIVSAGVVSLGCEVRNTNENHVNVLSGGARVQRIHHHFLFVAANDSETLAVQGQNREGQRSVGGNIAV